MHLKAEKPAQIEDSMMIWGDSNVPFLELETVQKFMAAMMTMAMCQIITNPI